MLSENEESIDPAGSEPGSEGDSGCWILRAEAEERPERRAEIHQVEEMKLEHQGPEDWEAPLYPDRRCYQIPQEWVD